MNRQAATATPSSCPRCQGPLCLGRDGDLGCLYCGECVYAPATPGAESGWDALLPQRPVLPTPRGRRRHAA